MCVGKTPLGYAAEKGHLSVVEHLIEHNANIEGKDNNGMSLGFASAVLFSLYTFAVWC